MMKGLPGSGKSTQAMHLVEQRYVRVNKDDLRAEFPKMPEKWIVQRERLLAEGALDQGKDVVVDDTNFNPIHEAFFRELANQYGAEFEINFVDVPIDVCIEQDLNRLASVGEAVIRRMYNQYLRVVETPKDANKGCYIFDIDGTLAHMQGRSPYDESKVLEDKPDEYVQMINLMIASWREEAHMEDYVKIFIVSGRHDSCEEDTRKWLDKHDIQYDEIFMRPTLPEGQQDPPDTEVKAKIYEEHINGQYKVLGVFDDRNRVVEMWRNKGLKCFHVQEGDF